MYPATVSVQERFVLRRPQNRANLFKIAAELISFLFPEVYNPRGFLGLVGRVYEASDVAEVLAKIIVVLFEDGCTT